MAKIKSQIVFLQPVFCPSEKLFQLNKNSLLSLLNYVKSNPYRLDIRLGGWAINDEYWNQILKIVEEFKLLEYIDIDIKRFKHNYGKSYIINKLSSSYFKTKSTKYILTFDSDIEIDSTEKQIFERLIVAAEKLEESNKCPFGCLTLNLKPNQHNDFKYKDKELIYDFENYKEELRWDSDYLGGFAGGALFISKKSWKKMGGYKKYNQTYAPEDAFLFLALNGMGFSFAIIKSLSVIHPDNICEDYTEWKKFIMNRKYIIFDKYDKECFMANVKDSEEFWKNYNQKKEIVNGKN